MKTLRAMAFVAILATAPVGAQESAAAVTGYSVKVEFENDQIKVTRVRYAAHAKSPMHSHTGRTVVAITPSHLRVTTSDGNVRETERRAGEIYWGDSVTHSAENLNDAPLETVEIEVKGATTPAVAVSAKPVDTAKLKEPVPVEQEPHHHVVLQNQYARVLDVFFPVGEPALFHTHSNDNVSVELSGDKSHSQAWSDKDNGKWSDSGDVVPGRIGFHKAVGQPYTHRVGSAGAKPYHVIDVEIFAAAAH